MQEDTIDGGLTGFHVLHDREASFGIKPEICEGHAMANILHVSGI